MEKMARKKQFIMFSTDIDAKKSERKCTTAVWWPAPEQHLKIWQCGTEIPKKVVFKGRVQLCGLFFETPTEAFN